MPSILQLGNSKTHVPSVIAGCVLSYMFCGIGLAVPEFAIASQNIAILSAMVTYVAQLVCYYMLRTKFSSVERDFRSPIGLTGAVFAALVITLCFISTAFFQDDDNVAFYSFLLIVLSVSTYYYFFARSTQVFSKHEHGTVFRLHVINYNTRKQRQKEKHIAFSPARLQARTSPHIGKVARGIRTRLSVKVLPINVVSSAVPIVEHHYSENSNHSIYTVQDEERNNVEEHVCVESYREDSKVESICARELTEEESLSYKK